MALEKDVKIGDVGDVDFAVQPDGKIAITCTIGKHFDATDTSVSNVTKIVQGEKPLLDKLVAGLPAGLLKEAAQKAEDLALAAQSSAAAPAAPVADHSV